MTSFFLPSMNNVNVKMDNLDDTDHTRFVIVDDETVYVGSHSWSKSALYYNYETSIKIENLVMANS